MFRLVMQVNGPTVANSVRLSGATHRALQRLAQLERRSLAGQAAYLPEQALAVEQRLRGALAVGGHRARSTRRGATVDEEDEGERERKQLDHLGPVLAVDRERHTVTVSAGTRYSHLCRERHRQGFALRNLASLPHIGVAGAHRREEEGRR